MRVLLIEDDEAIAAAIMQSFRGLGWFVQWDARGAALAGALEKGQFDAAILDIALPDIDGITALEQVRSRRVKTPILLLTARDAVNDRVKGLEAGADDYLVKPFAVTELVARVRALVRRAASANGEVIEFGAVRMDRRAHRAFVGEQAIELSQREWAMLELLLLESERVVSKDELMGKLAGTDAELSENAVEVYIFRLRRKLAGADVNLRTVRGYGYALEKAPGSR
ncbi:MAG TPA: response regulator transcription factor [Burkholderiaceae bacterium]|nr:response regulator transcription factor [Burkholderiaceae bacterium]